MERAKACYVGLGWQADVDLRADDLGVAQLTPAGSACPIIVGEGITPGWPGELRSVRCSTTPVVSFTAPAFSGRVPGLDPQRRSYASFASFNDPDGNGWLLQEVSIRPPRR